MNGIRTWLFPRRGGTPISNRRYRSQSAAGSRSRYSPGWGESIVRWYRRDVAICRREEAEEPGGGDGGVADLRADGGADTRTTPTPHDGGPVDGICPRVSRRRSV